MYNVYVCQLSISAKKPAYFVSKYNVYTKCAVKIESDAIWLVMMRKNNSILDNACLIMHGTWNIQ